MSYKASARRIDPERPLPVWSGGWEKRTGEL